MHIRFALWSSCVLLTLFDETSEYEQGQWHLNNLKFTEEISKKQSKPQNIIKICGLQM